MTLEEMVSKYIKNTERVFCEIRLSTSSIQIEGEEIKGVVEDAKRYLEDANIRFSDKICLDISLSRERDDPMKKKVLFICTHNSARSQMAEGFLNALYGDGYEGFSAGTEPTNVNPYAVKAMAGIGIDISTYRSKSIEDFHGKNFNYVVTLCNHAKATCPFFPEEKIFHNDFEDLPVSKEPKMKY